MPRRNRRQPPAVSPGKAGPGRDGRETQSGDSAPPFERIAGPAWAQTEGYQVRQSLSETKAYRCPYCQGWIEPGIPNLLVFPVDHPEDRRHYHIPCWSKKTGKIRP